MNIAIRSLVMLPLLMQSVTLASHSHRAQDQSAGFQRIRPMFAREGEADLPITPSQHVARQPRSLDVAKKESRFLTMFTAPFMAQEGSQKHYIQLNTLKAMAFLPGTQVVVFTDDDEMVEQVAELRLSNVHTSRDFKSNQYGTPILSSMYITVERDYPATFVGYTNADIMFHPDLITSLKEVYRQWEHGNLLDRILVVGHRFNVDMDKTMHDEHRHVIRDPVTARNVHKDLASRAKKFQGDAQDFFIITPGSFDWESIPDFVIGRPAYDNWLVDYATHQGMSTVDVTKTVKAVHQTDEKGNKAGHVRRPDKNWNLKLGKGKFDHGWMHHCRFETQPGEGGQPVKLHKRGNTKYRIGPQ
jgi:hypothetical protein